MYLLEHDAKELLAAHGIPVPAGTLVTAHKAIGESGLPTGPWVVKGQIAAGGRGKAGIIRKAATTEEADAIAREILGKTVKGKRVDSVRIEQQVAGAEEAYIGFLIDPAAAGVRVIVSESGGVDIEALPHDAIQSETVAPDHEAMLACVKRLTAGMAAHKATALQGAAAKLTSFFLEREAVLVEINPLFVRPDGAWVAGDAKVVTDDNALERQDALSAMLKERAVAYPEAALKMEQGFDYVVVDPEGEIGLLTTGAGLSMMLIDELRAAGLKPFNFLDIRTGGLRGETTRLVKVLQWLGEAPRVRVVLINVFAGITDLGEFSKLLVSAIREAPALQVPVVARLVGNRLPAAREVLKAAGIALHTDLDDALADVQAHLTRS
ncbi:MAG TPA: ATP-grasp domain-containing protein [Burkholderiales bacterium]|nr:ATP-grasp domain-containing protein [Burkholderiales bacterium]